jgi:putative DNA primase/helicase
MGRGRATNARLQEINRWRTICLTTGEESINKTVLNGAGVRAISFNIPMKKMDAGSIEKSRAIIECNYGHIIDLYMKKVFERKDTLQAEFIKVSKNYIKSGQSTALNRMGSYFAIIEVAGSILEDVFKDIGIPSVEPKDVVAIFCEYIKGSEQEDHHIKALRCLNDLFNMHASNFFENDGYTPNKDVYGYFSKDYIDVIPKVVLDALKANNFGTGVIKELVDARVIVKGKEKNTARLRLKSDDNLISVYRFDKKKIEDLLNETEPEETFCQTMSTVLCSP